MALTAGLFACWAASGAGAAEPADAGASAQQLAQQLTQKYPAGSITTSELAERALAQATAVHEKLESEFDAQRRHCADVFFVTHCLGVARDAQRQGEQAVRRVTLEAHDLRRHSDARVHQKNRAEELRRQDQEEALRPQREQEALSATQARLQNAAAREDDARKDEEAALKASASTQQRLQTQQADEAKKDQLRPAQETAAEQAYRKKQADAAEYARSKAEDKKVNVEKRAQRQTEREAQNRADEARQSAAPPAPK
jgi:hypothetical protein